MALTIGGAFDLLFKYDARAAADGALGIPYEERRWFRKPRPYGLNQNEAQLWGLGAQEAEQLLLKKVLVSLSEWRRRLSQSPFILPQGRIVPEFPNINPSRHLPPRSPYDVFAVAAFIVDNSGLYHHLQTEKGPAPRLNCNSVADAHGQDSLRHLAISAADRALVTRAARAWRSLPRDLLFDAQEIQAARQITEPQIWDEIEPLFESWAVVFAAHADAEVFTRLRSTPLDGDPAPLWWRHVWRLFAIADEAARGTAFVFESAMLRSPDSEMPWFESELYLEQALRLKRRIENQGGLGSGPSAFDMETLSVARPDVVGVLPKVRTPSVGCTLRSLSHHLAITPGQGIARGRWTPNFKSPKEVDALPKGQLNVLLVPFPYVVEAHAFCGSLVEQVDPAGDGASQPIVRFGYFDVHQHWLKAPLSWIGSGSTVSEQLKEYVRALMDAARAQAREIHAVVFPELSLDSASFHAIRDLLEDEEHDVELFIAGVSEKPAESGRQLDAEGAPMTLRHGNFVAVTSFPPGRRTRGREPGGLRTTIREKHHRWKLDRDQLRDYGLLGVLTPEIQWWENIALQSRRLDFTVIRQRSVLSAMICEDLARVDPCQQLIRSIAPNLVVALLMDAPQMADRWPARYATVLAEDPGTAVLTVTSRGLMARQDRLGIYRSKGEDRTVAMWRDDQSGRPKELNCPYDAQALLLTIIEETAEDISLDGRRDQAAAFRYGGHFPVRLSPEVAAKPEFAYLQGDGVRQ